MLIVALLRIALGLIFVIRDTAYNPPYLRTDYANEAWGVILIGVGVTALYAAIEGSVQPARWALLLAIITSGFWLGQLVADGWAFGVAFLVALIFKDGVMLRNPLRDPFDRLVAKKLATTRK